jgi:hypothetical protein
MDAPDALGHMIASGMEGSEIFNDKDPNAT